MPSLAHSQIAQRGGLHAAAGSEAAGQVLSPPVQTIRLVQVFLPVRDVAEPGEQRRDPQAVRMLLSLPSAGRFRAPAWPGADRRARPDASDQLIRRCSSTRGPPPSARAFRQGSLESAVRLRPLPGLGMELGRLGFQPQRRVGATASAASSAARSSSCAADAGSPACRED